MYFSWQISISAVRQVKVRGQDVEVGRCWSAPRLGNARLADPTNTSDQCQINFQTTRQRRWEAIGGGGVPGVPGDGDGQLPSRKWCQPTTGQPYKTSHIQNGSSKKIDFCRSFEFQTASFWRKKFFLSEEKKVFPRMFFCMISTPV